VLSRREGSCVVVAESMFADTPVALLDNAVIGSRAFINDQTGRFSRRTPTRKRSPRFRPHRRRLSATRVGRTEHLVHHQHGCAERGAKGACRSQRRRLDTGHRATAVVAEPYACLPRGSATNGRGTRRHHRAVRSGNRYPGGTERLAIGRRLGDATRIGVDDPR